jgi:hypothetical protein
MEAIYVLDTEPLNKYYMHLSTLCATNDYLQEGASIWIPLSGNIMDSGAKEITNYQDLLLLVFINSMSFLYRHNYYDSKHNFNIKNLKEYFPNED